MRNANNQIVANQSIGVKISIVEGSLTGTTVYSETHTTATNANGLFSLEVGGGTPTAGTFSTINWGNGSHYIKSEIDVTGGTNYALSGTMELLSVPYALYAATSGGTIGNSEGFKHYIGELFGGGIVVAVWKINGVEHGLIASLTNLGTNLPWTTTEFQNSPVGLLARNTNIGLENTNAIVAQAGAGTNYAAGLCKAYNAGGFTDWYLPAINELRLCYNSQPIVVEILGDTNGFYPDIYWSSTEFVSTNWSSAGMRIESYSAFFFFFVQGEESVYEKSNPGSVRAVRRF